MKKMLIGAIMALLAVGAQAAAINWSSNGFALTDASGTAISSFSSGSLVLVVMSSATDWASAVAIPTQATEGTTVVISTRATSLGTVTGKLQFAYSTTDTSGNLVNNGDFLGLMVQGSDGSLSQLVYTSGDSKGEKVAAVWEVAGLANNSTALSGKALSFTGNFAAVPEPTSGLLMLLGCAGLALRRKRA